MTKQIRLGVLLLLTAVLLAGCSSQRKIEGTWTSSTSASHAGTAMNSVSTYVFNPDNTMAMKHHVAFSAGSFDGTESGTYKLDGTDVDCTLTSASIQSAGFDGRAAPPKTITLNAEVTYTWALKGSNTLDLTVTKITGLPGASSAPTGKVIELTKQT